MDLWIRSQDRKRIVKSEQIITLEFTGKTECEIFNNTVKLGEYKNIERTLKVLDEIQNILIDYSKISRVVYQMPKE